MLLGEEGGEDVEEFGVFAHGDVADYAFGVDYELGGEAFDGIGRGGSALLGVLHVDPGEFIFCHCGSPCFGRVAAVHSEHFEFVAVGSVGFLEFGEAFYAPSAP